MFVPANVVLAGMGWGDEGKGSMTDYLVREGGAERNLVIRYNGGPQAAHNVVLPNGTHHTFAQFGSGTLAGARTFLSDYMLIEPRAFLNEAEVLAPKMGMSVADLLKMVTVSPDCLIVTPMHIRANILREQIRGRKKHGTTGFGVGEARGDDIGGLGIRLRDMIGYRLHSVGQAKFQAILQAKRKEFGASDFPEVVDEAVWQSFFQACRSMIQMCSIGTLPEFVPNETRLVFEGAQGVLLDETLGTAPHNTWTDTTFRNAVSLFDRFRINPESVYFLGVTRTFHTRHGAGPFPSEIPGLQLITDHNYRSGSMAGEFRIGHLDLSALGYSASVLKQSAAGRLDGLAVTYMDMAADFQIVRGSKFKQHVKDRTLANMPVYPLAKEEWETQIVNSTGFTPIKYLSYGPTWLDKYLVYV